MPKGRGRKRAVRAGPLSRSRTTRASSRRAEHNDQTSETESKTFPPIMVTSNADPTRRLPNSTGSNPSPPSTSVATLSLAQLLEEVGQRVREEMQAQASTSSQVPSYSKHRSSEPAQSSGELWHGINQHCGGLRWHLVWQP